MPKIFIPHAEQPAGSVGMIRAAGSANMLRKPLSYERVKLNEHHPLNRGLVAWWLFNEGGNAVVDLMKNAPLQYLVSGITRQKIFGEPSIYFDGTAGINTGLTSIGGVDFYCDTDPFSILLCVKKATAQAGSYISRAGSTVGQRTFQIFTDGESQIATTLRGTQTGTTFLWSDTPQVFVLTYKGSGSAEAYLKGYSDPQLMSVGTDTTNTEPIRFGIRNGGGTNYVGNMYYCQIWKRYLRNVEVQSLFNTPYGTPSNPRLIKVA